VDSAVLLQMVHTMGLNKRKARRVLEEKDHNLEIAV
jgi:hypothetical protein